MYGLYRKALEIYKNQSHLRLVRPDELEEERPEGAQEPDEISISPEEKEKIVARIDRIMERSRIEISPETLAYTPKRSGAILPLISNISLFAAVVVVVVVTGSFLNRREQSMASGQETILTAESKLIAALKQESAQQLQQKDRAIVEIQQKLQTISKEREQLRSQTDSQIQARAKELTADLERQLAEEKKRLEAQGVSAAEAKNRLSQFEQTARQKYADDLAAARRQAEAALADKARQISSLSAQYDQQLAAAQADRVKLQEELAQKEAQLQSQYQQREQALESERAKATSELDRVRRQQEEENLVLDQITSGYLSVNRALSASDYALAAKNLDALKQLLDQPAVALIPAVSKRRSVELFLIGSLDELIRARATRSPQTAPAPAETSIQLQSVSNLVERGDRLSRAGDLAAAREAYLSALGMIPAISHGYGKIEEIRKTLEEGSDKRALEGIKQGNSFLQAGNFLSALDRYRASLSLLVKDEGISRQLTDNIMNIGYKILAADELAQLKQLRSDAQRRQAVLSRIRELKDRSGAASRPTTAPTALQTPSPESLAALLQAKITVRLLLDSEPLKSQYPGLGTTLDQYFSALATQSQADGRGEVLKDVNSLLDALASSRKPANAELAKYMSSSQADPLASMLERLQALLQ